MGASRETQNIFFFLRIKKYKHVWYLIKNFNKTTYSDTIGPIICKYFGHKPYHHPNFEPDEYACKRCNRYVDYNARLEKLKKLKKISNG